MKKLVLGALAASAALIAAPASAQNVTGTVNITGSVGEKCIVIEGGGGTSSSFSTNVALGELAQADGRLRTDVATTFNAGGTGASALVFRVVCTTAAPEVSVDATQITAATSAPGGYANRIDYTAHVAFDLVSGGPQTVSNDSGTNAAPTVATLTDRLTGTGNNITITASNFRTPSASDVLVADPSYSGSIAILIKPTA